MQVILYNDHKAAAAVAAAAVDYYIFALLFLSSSIYLYRQHCAQRKTAGI